jgi:biopolymer transport protein TolR
MAFSGGGDNKSMVSEINVTPLVDVMLVLLIIFMVTAPIIKTGVDVDLPQGQATTIDPDESKLIITIDKNQKVFLGKAEVPIDQLEAVIKSNAKLQADREAYLEADKTIPYGFVVRVMALVKLAGVNKLGMVMDPTSTDLQTIANPKK